VPLATRASHVFGVGDAMASRTEGIHAWECHGGRAMGGARSPTPLPLLVCKARPSPALMPSSRPPLLAGIDTVIIPGPAFSTYYTLFNLWKNTSSAMGNRRLTKCVWCGASGGRPRTCAFGVGWGSCGAGVEKCYSSKASLAPTPRYFTQSDLAPKLPSHLLPGTSHNRVRPRM